MGLALRPTGLNPPADKDRSGYTLFSGEFAVGRIYEERGAPADVQWFWAITGIFGAPADMRMDGHAPTLESAQAQLGESWRKCRSWPRSRARDLPSREARRQYTCAARAG